MTRAMEGGQSAIVPPLHNVYTLHRRAPSACEACGAPAGQDSQVTGLHVRTAAATERATMATMLRKAFAVLQRAAC